MSYIFLTISFYLIFTYLQKFTKITLLNPVLLTITSIILILNLFKIDYETYISTNRFISLFLGPATVALALPLYKNIHILKDKGLNIIVGVCVGSIVAISSVWGLCKIFNVDENIILSMLPKSVTTPIGMEVSRKIGGEPSLTVALIVITGLFGNMSGALILNLFKIKDSVAVGASLGTSCHAIGTSKALEIGEVEGAISGLSIGLAGLMTSLLIPLFLAIIN